MIIKLLKLLTFLFVVYANPLNAQKNRSESIITPESEIQIDLSVYKDHEKIQSVNPGDIVISEILFNPRPQGADYVELFNKSNKTISTNQLLLASRNSDFELVQIYPVSVNRILLEPGSYLALTKDTGGVFPFYTIKCPDCILQMSKFPSFNDKDDVVVLLNENLLIIDEMAYSEKMHHSVIYDKEGISLERISFSVESNLRMNWHSASSLAGFGTPGYENSQRAAETENKPMVEFEPEYFSPDSDGYNDEYRILFHLKQSGFVTNVYVFDEEGKFVLQLAKNEILGTEEEIKWNGTDASGRPGEIGLYVVLVEIFDLNGRLYHFKDGMVLTRKFE